MLASVPDLLFRLRSGERLIADGAVGTELIRLGVDRSQLSGANILDPGLVKGVHHSYLMQGCRLLTSNTFLCDGTPAGSKALELGFAHALECTGSVEQPIYLMLSVACGTLTEIHANAVKAVASDNFVLWIETTVSLEAGIAEVEKAVGFGFRNIGLSFCPSHWLGQMSPAQLADARAVLDDTNVSLIGLNCGLKSDDFVSCFRNLRSITELPIAAQPSAGEPAVTAEGHLRYPLQPGEFADLGMQLFSLGANVVGGCCGTSPAHIRQLAQRNYITKDK